MYYLLNEPCSLWITNTSQFSRPITQYTCTCTVDDDSCSEMTALWNSEEVAVVCNGGYLLLMCTIMGVGLFYR